MAQRKTNIIHIPSDEAQGEGSFIEFRSFTWGQQKHVAKTLAQLDASGTDSLDEIDKLIATHLVGWNWVDGDGKPLPLPTEADPSPLDALENIEINFLIGSIKTALRGLNADTEKK
jgi:hypothetical protein